MDIRKIKLGYCAEHNKEGTIPLKRRMVAPDGKIIQTRKQSITSDLAKLTKDPDDVRLLYKEYLFQVNNLN